MNVLFLLPRFSENKNDSSLEKELVMEFAEQGHQVYVSIILERYLRQKTHIKEVEGVQLLKIRTGNYYKDNIKYYERGITYMVLPFIFYREISRLIGEVKIDLVILSTPMMNNPWLMGKLKQKFGCKVILIIWDIFPQNGIDMGIIKNKQLIRFLTNKYTQALKIADIVTAMSLGNRKYLAEHFKLDESKLLVLKNWAKITPQLQDNRKEIRQKYSFHEDDFLLIFGGNMGKPQRLENLLNLAQRVKNDPKVKILFVGKGTELTRLETQAQEMNLSNVSFIYQIPRKDYEELTKACDIGLVSLDERFTIPNYPSKTTDYFKLGLPILASLDACSAQDYGVFLRDETKTGLFGRAGDGDDLYQKFLELYRDNSLRQQMGRNGRQYYEACLGVNKAYQTLMDKYKELV